MDWECEVEPVQSHFTSTTTISLQMVSSFLQQNPHLINQLNISDDTPEVALDF